MMAVEVLTTEEFEEWFDELDKQQGRAVAVKVGLCGRKAGPSASRTAVP
jgi:hypothetical protein